MSNTPYTLACQSQGRVQHGSILSGNLRPTRVTSQWKSTVVGIFPNEDSIIRLVGAVLLEQNDEYQLQHRYMQIEGMAALATPITEEVQPLQITPKAA